MSAAGDCPVAAPARAHGSGRSLLSLLCGLATAFAASGASAATRGYIVTDFDSVRLEGPIEVTVRTGRGVSARGEGDADLLDRVQLSVSARVLTIRLRPSPYEARRGTASSGPIRLFLSAPSLRRVQLSGAGTLRADGLARARSEIVTAGSGTLEISGIDADDLSVAQLGAGSITLSGKAKRTALRASGSGVIAAEALRSADFDLTLDGSADVTATAERSARLIVIGSGSARIEGPAACTVSRSGNGAVLCGGKSY
ncbi:head GIN domain-containing protein [Sphingobium lignivorans]|uniref:Putative auto-transporter adhesin head GIN domain-containing protein n=1 Tax=Sphingobium lignivorans TaxID=2735886 RepID=A0ABR6NJC9_9SPHN|nr:head GIN domain-containing protein [Sphingobium lignivorans]MBB5987380.1 hypothetical protein [Sphingobium lignivorans]